MNKAGLYLVHGNFMQCKAGTRKAPRGTWTIVFVAIIYGSTL